ncbi:hypothetical protein [Iningainema tapete]|uniref:Uncharacterized protein n=1 Tax=Iningainema tapete BLCC-T55 TaxID=2748662 RepID=A0A8J7CGJ4_9CYAN|nr:hypothetical protein [Iningainema tapete]MBD2776445.1 hypothetical protein [Iningainema tapete BLCC-T55]
MNKPKPNQNKRYDNYQNESSFRVLFDIGVLMTLILVTVLLRGCNFFDSDTTIANTSEIVNNTDEFIGKNATIRSRPIEKIGLSSFTVSDARFFRGEPILVVNGSGVPFNLPVDRNTEVQVTGQVRKLVIPKIEREFNLNIQDEYYKDYIDKPAIIAQYITLAPKPGQVTQSPRQYYGRKVTVKGEVKNIRSPVLLTLDEDQLLGGQDLLVLLKAPPKVAINEGQTVAAIGEVRPFVVAEIERDYDLTWDLNVKKQLEVEGSPGFLV